MSLQPNPAAKRLASAPANSSRQDTLSSIANHVSSMTSRIHRLSAINQRVRTALTGEAPEGVSRIDWIARRLNEA